jgi:hypothetical protein
LNRAVFNGQTTFQEFETDDHFIANEAQFNNTESPVELTNLIVGKTLFLEHAVFNGPTNFAFAEIGGDFTVNGSEFNNIENQVNFGDIKVGNNFYLIDAIFHGPVRFTYLEVGQLLDASGAQFKSSTGEVNLGESKVGTSIMLNRSIIAGPLDARYVHVGYNFEAQDAQFTNTESGLYAENMIILELLLLKRSTFAGPVDFGHSTVGGYIGAEDTVFSNQDATVFLGGMDVGELYLDRAVIAGKLFITNTKTKRFNAKDTTWPEGPGMIDIRGLEYSQELGVNNDKGQGLLYLAEQSPYDAKLYTALQEYYIAHGFPAYADFVYRTYKTREGTEGYTWTTWRWWWNAFLRIFILYGKVPELAALWFLAIVLFGWFMFRKRAKMFSLAGTERKYRPLFYSLDLFLPVIDLGYAKKWTPNTRYKIIRIYSVIHRCLGLVLIPIAILAFLGILK